MTLSTFARAGLVAFALAAPLAGCGKLGELERPGPLTGAGRASTRASDEQVRQTSGESSRPVDTVDPRDRASDPAPPRTIPIEGGSGSSSAARPAPAGALPDPYANPR